MYAYMTKILYLQFMIKYVECGILTHININTHNVSTTM